MRLFFQSIECKGNCDFHCRHSLSHCFSRRRPIQRLAGGANQIIKTPNGALKPEVCTDAYTSPAGNRLSQVKMGSDAQGGVVTKRDCRSPAGNNASRRPLRRRGVYCAAVRGMKLCTILDIISSMNFLIGGVMSNTKKVPVGYVKPSRTDIARSVATSTAVETGQPSARIEASLEEVRKKFAHLRLA
ncbi:hypothetical protein PTR80_16470 [Serratia nevei]|uniref:hypothetical protein n=1 Tax=Serratia nevei TaxID=2703794 RepID=UPI00313D0D3D